MSVEPTPGPFRDAGGAGVRRAYWALARRLHDEVSAHTAAAPARMIEGPPVSRTGTPGSSGDGSSRRRPRSGRSTSVLADEVAIDFPSMAPIVARMRAAFFAEAGERGVATRRAEVELTAQQADQGVRVPLDLTVPHTCPACGGRGESWTDRCGLCDGSGAGFLSHRLHFRVPPGVRHGTRLRYSVTPPHAFETHIEVRIAVQ
ncbi:MAG: hypothetical protein OXG04_18570 [Acidobacteria bacterium]|nr:hypothetical protein [Acidobacteriota bacterium]